MSPQLRVLFLILFFLSGAAGLLYEVLWLRMLSVTFGATTFAISITLASFMGGLALGSDLGGRYAPRLKAPARMYGILEGAIGIYAFLLPSLIPLARLAYRGVYNSLEPGPILFGLMQGSILFLLLLIPTTLMGATFPILVQAVSPRGEEAGTQVGRLYAANAAGAMCGCLAAGFVLLPELGIRNTTLFSVIVNLTVAGMAWMLGNPQHLRSWEDALESDPGEVVTPSSPAAAPWPGGKFLWLGAALTGAAAMIYEVAWHRLLALQLGSSVYAFSTMLGTFLLGLSLGGVVAAATLRRWPLSGTTGFMVAEFLAALMAFGGVLAFPEIPIWYVQLYQKVGGSRSGFDIQLTLAAIVMLPPAVALGAALPFALSVGASRPGELTTGVARVYASNTVGAIAGSLLAGFWLLHTLGIQKTLLVAIGINLLAVLVVGTLRWNPRRLITATLTLSTLMAGFAAARPEAPPMLMSAGFYRYVNDMKEFDRDKIRDWALEGSDLLFYEDGLTSTVSVGQSRKSENRWLANNGKVDASTAGDLSTQLMVSHLPMLLHPDPEQILLVGLASGISLGALTRYPSQSFDVLEIEEAILRATRFFDKWNYNPLEDPRVKVIANDARNHLVLSNKTWDVIVSEPSNPWLTGVSNLFTREFWLLASSRLAPGGILCQWIQLYDLSPRELKILLRTFHSVFPHVLLFGSIEDSDIIVIGSLTPFKLDPARMELMMARREVVEDLRRIEIDSSYDVLTWMLHDTRAVEQMGGEGLLNTDDNAWIEFQAPLFLYAETSEENLRLLLKHRVGPEGWLEADPTGWGGPDAWLGLGEAYRQRKMFNFASQAAESYLDHGGEFEVYEMFQQRLQAAVLADPDGDPSVF